jgi:zinc protease
MKKFVLALSFLCFAQFGVARGAEVSFEKDSTLPLVYLNVAIKAGTVTDPDDQSGLTNFMGEMLMRGTRSKTKEQIDIALDQMGARLAVETRAESMIIRGAVLSSQFEPFLSLLNEIITQPSFPENEIRKLKAEISSGILQELGNDASLATRRFTEFLFRGHPYGKPILGTLKGMEKLNRASIIKHYDRLIQDRYLLVVGTGDAETQRIEGWSKVLSAARPDLKNTKPIEKVAAPESSQQRRYVIFDKPERTQTQINSGQIGVTMKDPRFFPLYLGNHSFGGGSFQARMMVEIRVKRGWSYGANSYFRYGLEPRSWQFHLFPAAKDTQDALAYSLKMVEDLKANGLNREEFEFAKNSLVNSSGFMYDTPKKRAENKLLERTLDLPEGFMKSYGSNLSKLTLEEVNEALKSFLRPEQMAVTVLGTASTLKEPLAKALHVSPDKIEVVPFTDSKM